MLRALALLFVGCGDDAAIDAGAGIDAAVSDAGLDASFDASSDAGEGPCVVSTIPIAIDTRKADRESGEIGGMKVPVVFEGREGFLAIDTGSALTFLYLGNDGPEYVEHAGTVELGCERVPLPGRNFEDEDPSIVGVLGADVMITVPSAFDPIAATFTRHLDGTRPDGTEGYSELAFENVRDHALVRLDANGRNLRLMWDTGSPHLLWVGEMGEPGDVKTYVSDVEGTVFPVWIGSASVVLGGEPARDLRVLRAPEFPYFETTVEILGGDIQGLAGQSTLGHRRIVFDPDGSRMLLGPRMDPR
jgi:hypothetical protein